MSKRYIDADAVLSRLPDDLPYKASVKRVLMQAPTADAVAVVRCRDCKHNADNGGDCDRTITHTSRNYVCEVNEYKYISLEYCSCGERREE